MCGRNDETGRSWCRYYLDIDAGALWRLGLHPEQPLSRIVSRPPAPSHVKKILAERAALAAWQR
ncbi:hypothetical protein GCM10010112_34390 [Actinoplanes lobatus]|uniref:Uncharacterized protein n=1 Tax=Actinoplanes lobatus TaxID=113568 RepID=A0A7W7HHI6_9ACTN|nr:hypothetical protein [Actinoplanes lobatus]MBB4750669.1 hypothetical protein [Actinoplanes lobatus]GGN69167.1 hypothetical protein GCM10010112_34390 [Actinoplanes lobatus]GIE44201.1 hypothetical protein Alo02nite_70990 [Actinoplanes lobatus]